MPCTLKQFVANRVAAIQQLLPDVTWRHVSTHCNPTDMLSRGMPADHLIESDLWWHGPPWLCQPENSWPSSGIMALPQSLPELKAVTLTTIVESVNPWSLWSRYSNFSTLTRVLSWIKRFINNARSSVQHRTLQPTLTSEDISSTRIFIIHCAQEDSCSDVFYMCKKKRGLPKQHPFRG